MFETSSITDARVTFLESGLFFLFMRVRCFPQARNSNIQGARGVFLKSFDFCSRCVDFLSFLVGNSNLPGARGNI